MGGNIILSVSDNISGIYVFHPTIPGYPNARFPGVVVFSEIYQGDLIMTLVVFYELAIYDTEHLLLTVHFT